MDLATEDMAFLQSKGALSLPSINFQNALLLSFFEFVYPYLPIINIDEFLHCVGQGDGTAGQISLLLFQAILFAGISHVEMEHICEAGFRTRKLAYKTFFQRVLVSFYLCPFIFAVSTFSACPKTNSSASLLIVGPINDAN